MIRRAVGYKAPASVTLNLYKALIRPIAEYSCPLWSPFYKLINLTLNRLSEILHGMLCIILY